MPVYKVRVKWGKQKFEGVELNTDEAPAVFKMQLFSLSGVSPDRQKVMVAGSTVSDDEWGKTLPKIKDNVMLMMMGSVEELPQVPLEAPRFIEDMTDAEAAAALSLPVGLDNFGNTCYMNATLQCLKVVPELREALKAYQPAPAMVQGTSQSLTLRLKVLYDLMERDQAKVPLLLFLQALQDAVPHFAEKDEKTGVYCQQDAHECWSAIFTNLSQTLHLNTPQQSGGGQLKFMEHYFGLQLQSKYKCVDSAEEAEKYETEKSYQVPCFISQDIKYMHTGIKQGLEGSVEKHSPSLGRDAVYNKMSRISRLPSYLTVQFIRFFVGKAGDSEEIVAKKILKDIKFQVKLDLYEFCTPELQEKLLPARTMLKDVEDKKAALRAQQIAEGQLIGPKQSLKPRQDNVEYEPYGFPDDIGSSNSAFYDLVAVLTHKGRSSSSGHYLGWVRYREDEWLKLDDDMVTMVTTEEIIKLSGGGDWHTAYILLYAPRRVEKLKTDEPQQKMETEQSS